MRKTDDARKALKKADTRPIDGYHSSRGGAEDKEMMKYRLHIQDPHTYETMQIIVFSPVEEGTIIGWGADCREEDGIRKWIVFGCVADPYAY